MSDTIKINVGGKLFVTTRNTLLRFPDTKLYNIANSESKTQGEIFFDKNPKIFQSLLDYYRSGSLHINTNYCAEYVKEELEFWGFQPALLSPCCRKNFYNKQNETDDFSIIEKNFGVRGGVPPTEMDLKGKKTEGLTRRIWNFIEYPRSSRLATAWQAVYLIFVLGGIAGCSFHCFLFRSERHHQGNMNAVNSTFGEGVDELAPPEKGLKYVLILSFVYNSVFTLETIVRVVTCPNKKVFFTSLLNMIEVGASIAFLVFAFLSAYTDLSADLLKVLEFSGVVVIFQGFRFYRLERFCENLRLILLSLNQSKMMLCLLTMILGITALIFGALIHILEYRNSTDFNDPITCFYWAIVTMTTVGYGDIRPQTDGGKLVASICATMGLLLLSMPIAIVANDFSDLYTQYKAKHTYEEKTSKKRHVPFAWNPIVVAPN